jgi:uncharacterized membrane protein
MIEADVGTVGPAVRRIAPADLLDALAKGLADFAAMPSHALFLCVVYPIIGLVLAVTTLGFAVLPLLYPLAVGFALVGPITAIGLYELSRRREAGETVSIGELDLPHGRSARGIGELALLLMVIFVVWVGVAQAIYTANFGIMAPQSTGAFVRDVLSTPAGWRLIAIGNGVGFLFAVATLMISVVSFPLLLDRDIGAGAAVATSIRAVMANPMTMALWGLIVAALLLVGSLPLFLGLTVVLPVLGHSTWHLYRKVVEPDPNPRPEPPARPKVRRYAADFPGVLIFSWFEPRR